MILFLWLVSKDKNLTWSNLQKRGWQGPGMCFLYGKEEEDNLHMFYFCPFALETLAIVCGNLQINTLVYHSTEDYLRWWINRGESVGTILILFHWYIWCTRNRKLFVGIPCHPINTSFHIFSSWDSLKIIQKPPGDLSKRFHPHEIHFPVGFSDGVSQKSMCGYGAWLMISPDCHYKIFWNGGTSSNMKAEVLALWGILWFDSQLYMVKIWIIGDSKVFIYYMNQKVSINLGSIAHWLERINTLKNSFSDITF